MTTLRIGIRLLGRLPDDETLLQLTSTPLRVFRTGSEDILGEVRTTDVAVWELIRFNDERDMHARNQQVVEAIQTVRDMAPGLASLEDQEITRELYITTIRYHDQGGFELPVALIEVAALARLQLGVSISGHFG